MKTFNTLRWKFGNWCRDYLSGILVGIPIVAIIVAILWVVIFYTGITGLLVLTAFVSFVLSAIYTGYKHATPNGGGRSLNVGDYLPSFTVLAGIMLLGGFGINMFVVYYKTGAFNSVLFLGILVFVVGIPSGYFLIKELIVFFKARAYAKKYIQMPLKISHFNDLPIYITQLKFGSTKTGVESLIKIPFEPRHKVQQTLNKLEIAQRITESNHVFFNATVQIPFHSDKFWMSWYSFVEDVHYCDDFPFSLEKFTLKKDESYDYEPRWESHLLTSIERVHLIVKKDGAVDLFKKGFLIYPYYKVAIKTLSEDDRKMMRECLMHACFDKNEHTMNRTLMEIKSSQRIESRLEIENTRINWNISTEAIGEKLSVDISDANHNQYDSSLKYINEMEPRPLPEVVTLYWRISPEYSVRYYISLDVYVLFNAFTLLKSEIEETLFIHFEYNASFKKGLKLYLKLGERSQEIIEFGTRVVEFK